MSDKKVKKPANKQPKRRKVHRKWPRRIFGALLVALIVVVTAFSWNRWFRFDDAIDMQGEWKLSSASMTIVIDGEEIRLTKDVAYSYTLDTWAKTLRFTFGNLSGSGLYEFSADRKTLVIVEGRQPDIASVLGLVDLKKEAEGEQGGGSAGSGAQQSSLAGRSVFVKISDSLDASPASLANNSTVGADTVGAAIVAGDAQTPTASEVVTEPEDAGADAGVPASNAETAIDGEMAVDEAAIDATAVQGETSGGQ
ncbi:MAG: hypothetical protein RSB16_01385 [Raoultibacter sp.]